MLDNFKRATGPEICGRDVIISKILSETYTFSDDILICFYLRAGFFECYVLFEFVRGAFQTQRVSNLALRNALICIKLLHIEILLSLPRLEDKQGFKCV